MKKNQQFILVFSGGYLDDGIMAEEVINQLLSEQEGLGIKEVKLIDSPLAILLNNYVLTLSQKNPNLMNYDYSTIKITYEEPVAFQVNAELDMFLRNVILSMEEPCGAHYAYLVEDEGDLSFHNTSIVSGCSGIYETDDEGFYEEVISPDTLYRAFYNQPLQKEDHALIAKMLLIADCHDFEVICDF